VPFKDAGALMAAVVSGDVDFTAFSVNTVAGLLAAGRLRGLAVAARQRLASQPGIPTLAESGAPAVEMHPWAALVTVAGTPPPVLAQLQSDISRALKAPGVRARVDQAGFELTPSTPQALLDRVQADLALYAPLVAAGRVARF
jgi:tripartite-type tricarboxylate transporter receptor subunit TctC